MKTALRKRLETLLGCAIADARPVSGGDIADSWRIDLADGERCFVKRYEGALASAARCEARGLEWLREANAVPVARVRAFAEDDPILVLDWIEPGKPRPDFDEDFGRGLAALHESGAEHFGLEEGGFIGSLRLPNDPGESWADFYAERRLEPLLRRARDRGLLSTDTLDDATRLLDRLPELCGPEEPPARLHGDLWGGNYLCDADGRACLIDPSAYGGHREIDLAMMRLFGGFGARVFAAYEEHSPLAAGAAERVALYQLYPLLVHVNLFGGHYADAFASALGQYE